MISYRVHYCRLELARKNTLKKSISAGKKSGKNLELIVGFESRNRKQAISRLSSIGTLSRIFDLIPYASFSCSSKEGEMILSGTTRGYSEIRGLLRKIEVSSRFSIPHSRRARSKGAVWNLDNIGAYDAWNFSIGEGVNIAVIDTGIDYRHPEIADNFGKIKGYDFVENNGDPMDKNGHGTHVAGICAGANYGVSPGSALYAVRVLDENGSGSESNVIAGIEWAIKNGMDVANLSLGSPVASSAFEDICYLAWKQGLVVCAAAGNDGGEFAMYPAAFGEPVIAVAAVDRYNEHADFSNIFITNDASAPGVDIESSYLNGSYATLSGTSMATPHVSGSVALALPFIKNDDVFDVLDSNCKNIGSDREVYGAGLVRPDKMLMSLQNKRSLFELVKNAVW